MDKSQKKIATITMEAHNALNEFCKLHPEVKKYTFVSEAIIDKIRNIEVLELLKGKIDDRRPDA
jgi:hypothetical protein